MLHNSHSAENMAMRVFQGFNEQGEIIWEDYIENKSDNQPE